MSLAQQPFTKYHLEKKEDTFTIKLNAEERQKFNGLKAILRQPKDSTAMKQLALMIGAEVLLDKKTYETIKLIVENNRKNKRTGQGIEFEEN